MGLRSFISNLVEDVLSTTERIINEALSFIKHEPVVKEVPIGFGILDIGKLDIDIWQDWVKDIQS